MKAPHAVFAETGLRRRRRDHPVETLSDGGEVVEGDGLRAAGRGDAGEAVPGAGSEAVAIFDGVALASLRGEFHMEASRDPRHTRGQKTRGIPRIGAGDELREVGPPVAVCILRGVVGAEFVEAVRVLPRIGKAVAVVVRDRRLAGVDGTGSGLIAQPGCGIVADDEAADPLERWARPVGGNRPRREVGVFHLIHIDEWCDATNRCAGVGDFDVGRIIGEARRERAVNGDGRSHAQRGAKRGE